MKDGLTSWSAERLLASLEGLFSQEVVRLALFGRSVRYLVYHNGIAAESLPTTIFAMKCTWNSSVGRSKWILIHGAASGKHEMNREILETPLKYLVTRQRHGFICLHFTSFTRTVCPKVHSFHSTLHLGSLQWRCGLRRVRFWIAPILGIADSNSLRAQAYFRSLRWAANPPIKSY
jgi:hypothetical protein